MYAYCSNNPIKNVDITGEGVVWNWICDRANDAGEFLLNIGDAFWGALELEAGLGTGFGVQTSKINVGINNDFYVGIAGGKTTAGRVASAEIGILDFGLGVSAIRCSEYGGVRRFCKICGSSAKFSEMIKCRSCSKSAQLGYKKYSTAYTYNPEAETGDLIVSMSVGLHLGFGGHASAGFNASEFWRRLTD